MMKTVGIFFQKGIKGSIYTARRHLLRPSALLALANFLSLLRASATLLVSQNLLPKYSQNLTARGITNLRLHFNILQPLALSWIFN
jgi:hypothetical protein